MLMHSSLRTPLVVERREILFPFQEAGTVSGKELPDNSRMVQDSLDENRYLTDAGWDYVSWRRRISRA